MPASNPPKLTAKQEAFCRAIITEPDQSAAYRSVYHCKKATAKSINQLASRLMAQVNVRSRVNELKRLVDAQAIMGRKEWLERVSRIARADVRKMYDSHGNPLEIPEMGPNEAAAIAGFEFVEDFTGKDGERTAVGYTKKFKLVDPVRALELMGKASSYYADRMELTGPDGGPIQMDHRIEVVFVRPTLEVVKG